MADLKVPLLIESPVNELNDLISQTKTLYYENLAKKLNNPLLQAKTYWSILKTFYNDKKIPLIPPLLMDDTFITDTQAKANIFNKKKKYLKLLIVIQLLKLGLFS